jgi:hypothetical protein
LGAWQDPPSGEYAGTEIRTDRENGGMSKVGLISCPGAEKKGLVEEKAASTSPMFMVDPKQNDSNVAEHLAESD